MYGIISLVSHPLKDNYSLKEDNNAKIAHE